MTWKDLVEKAGVAEKNLIIDASYHPAMNDWAAAVRNLQEKKAGWKEFAADWFAQFVYNTDLKMTLGLSDTPQEVLLPVTEEDVAQDLYSEMLLSDNLPFDTSRKRLRGRVNKYSTRSCDNCSIGPGECQEIR
jgi:hypothetical protein